MYSSRSGLVLAFHGTDRETAKLVVAGEADLIPSTNEYDWLGHGIYFGDNSLSRAINFAEERKDRHLKAGRVVKEPSVLGGVIDLCHFLDLLDDENLAQLREAYDFHCSNPAMADNFPTNRIVQNSNDLLLRYLDCAVIETIHSIRRKLKKQPYDSVRGVF